MNADVFKSSSPPSIKKYVVNTVNDKKKNRGYLFLAYKWLVSPVSVVNALKQLTPFQQVIMEQRHSMKMTLQRIAHTNTSTYKNTFTEVKRIERKLELLCR